MGWTTAPGGNMSDQAFYQHFFLASAFILIGYSATMHRICRIGKNSVFPLRRTLGRVEERIKKRTQTGQEGAAVRGFSPKLKRNLDAVFPPNQGWKEREQPMAELRFEVILRLFSRKSMPSSSRVRLAGPIRAGTPTPPLLLLFLSPDFGALLLSRYYTQAMRDALLLLVL